MRLIFLLIVQLILVSVGVVDVKGAAPSAACHCILEYIDKGKQVEIFKGPQHPMAKCSDGLKCKELCLKKASPCLRYGGGYADLDYIHAKHKIPIGQFMCASLVKKKIMNVQKQTIEGFYQICKEKKSVGKKSQEKILCCKSGQYLPCLK